MHEWTQAILRNNDTALLMKHGSPGTATWTVVDTEGGPELVMLVLLSPGEADQVPAKPVIEMRTGVFQVSRVSLVAWMARIHGNADWLFEAWINCHSAEFDGFIRNFANDRLHMALIEPGFTTSPGRNPSFLKRVCSVDNTLRDFWCRPEYFPQDNPWTMSRFDAAREQVYASHSTPDSLWDAMTPAEPPKRSWWSRLFGKR